jgi:hypothetical protein
MFFHGWAVRVERYDPAVCGGVFWREFIYAGARRWTQRAVYVSVFNSNKRGGGRNLSPFPPYLPKNSFIVMFPESFWPKLPERVLSFSRK